MNFHEIRKKWAGFRRFLPPRSRQETILKRMGLGLGETPSDDVFFAALILPLNYTDDF